MKENITYQEDSLNGRIKILWIEDNLLLDESMIIRWEERYSPYYVIVRVESPADVRDLLNMGRAKISTSMGNHIYSLCEMPFDIYLSDFKLSDAISEPGDRSGEIAKEATAAGLLTALISSLNFPLHPAGIIPYTAYPDEAESILELVAMLLPPVGQSNLQRGEVIISKQNQMLSTMFVKASSMFRDILIASPNYILTSREVKAIQKKLPIDDSTEVKWKSSGDVSSDDYISFYTPWGWRKVLLSALWLDYAHGFSEKAHLASVLTSTESRSYLTRRRVNDWLNQLDTSNFEYNDCLKKAINYFNKSHSIEAQLRYDIALKYPTNERTSRKQSPQAALQNARIWRDKKLEQSGFARANGDTVPDNLQCDHILIGQENPRLVTLMGVLLEFFMQWWFYEDCNLGKEIKGIVLPDADEDEIPNILPGFTLDEEFELGISQTARSKTRKSEDPATMQSKEIIIQRLLDPMPKDEWGFKISLTKDSKIGKGIERKLGDLDPKRLLNGERQSLTSSEQKSLRRLALEIDVALQVALEREEAFGEHRSFTPEKWPYWLKS